MARKKMRLVKKEIDKAVRRVNKLDETKIAGKPRRGVGNPPRKVALVGTAPSSLRAPIDDPSWEIWGTGFRSDHITRATRWFEIHRLEAERDGPDWRPLLKKWAKDCEMVMFWPEPLGPRVMQYPIDEIKTNFGTYFMTSTLSWMMALAIHEHMNGKPIAEIGVWGVDMEFGTEYREQRAGMMHFLNLSRFAGIPTNLQLDGGLVYQPVPYPFWLEDPLYNKLTLRREVAEQEVSQRQRVLDGSAVRMAEIKGILSAMPIRGEFDEKRRLLELERGALERAEPGLRCEVSYYQGSTEQIKWQLDYLRP